MGFTTEEAAALRNNMAKLYKLTRAAVDTAAEMTRQHPDIAATQVAGTVWKQLELDDIFHELGSQGYRQLIKTGWSPYHDAEEDDDWWRPKGGAED